MNYDFCSTRNDIKHCENTLKALTGDRGQYCVAIADVLSALNISALCSMVAGVNVFFENHIFQIFSLWFGPKEIK